MAAKDIIAAFEKEYYPMDFFSNQQCAQHFVNGWCAAKTIPECPADCVHRDRSACVAGDHCVRRAADLYRKKNHDSLNSCMV